MSTERMENMGHKVTLEAQARKLEMEVAAYRDSLRGKLPVHVEAHQLEGEAIAQLGITLMEHLQALHGIRRKIKVLSDSLGC